MLLLTVNRIKGTHPWMHAAGSSTVCGQWLVPKSNGRHPYLKYRYCERSEFHLTGQNVLVSAFKNSKSNLNTTSNSYLFPRQLRSKNSKQETFLVV